MAVVKSKRADLLQELFAFPENEASMKTNTPPSKLDAFVLSEVQEYALSLKGTKEVPVDPEYPEMGTVRVITKDRKDLSKVYRHAHDYRMISLRGQGRRDAIQAIAARDRESNMDEWKMGSY